MRDGATVGLLGGAAFFEAVAFAAQSDDVGVMDEPVRPWTGTVQAHYSDQFADLDQGFGFKFETAPVHPSLFALAVPWESGAQHSERMTQLAHTTICGILLRDRDGGRVTVDRDGNAVVHYRVSAFDHAPELYQAAP